MMTNKRAVTGSGVALLLFFWTSSTSVARAAEQVKTASGIVEGVANATSKLRIFKGIPFAAPPVGGLRWQPPQAVEPWQGVRKANVFGPRCMQGAIFSDMIFRDAGPSEDCLYLNVWTPAPKASAHLPVMVWIYGGGFQAGAASEPRQDGEKLAEKGVVVVSLNYRLGIFGFFSHPELTEESPHHASGNYGLLDQTAALTWVQKNIAAFGGDPDNVTIFGESAGSMSVSAQMASPLAKGLFKQAIGESGAMFPLTPPLPSLEKREQSGVAFGRSIGANNLQELRAKPGADLLKAALAAKEYRFRENVDGYFFPQSPAAIFASGQQAHVALLAGWNQDEQSAASFFAKDAMTKDNYDAKVRAEFGERASEVLKLYPAADADEMKASARDMASDRFIAYSTWKWIDEQLATGGAPVYRYHFEQVPPLASGEQSRGAYHSADIKYVFETLDSEKLAWSDSDRKISDMISSYWTNFAKTGDPNGAGLPKWPRYNKADDYQVMHLQVNGSVNPTARPDELKARYELLDNISQQRVNGHAESSASR